MRNRTPLIPLLLLLLVACDKFDKSNTRDEKSMDLARNNGCLECHALQAAKIGPPWFDIAQRYKDAVGARELLIQHVKNGSSGSWTDLTGGAVMPPNSPRVTDKDINRLVDFILSLGGK